MFKNSLKYAMKHAYSLCMQPLDTEKTRFKDLKSCEKNLIAMNSFQSKTFVFHLTNYAN